MPEPVGEAITTAIGGSNPDLSSSGDSSSSADTQLQAQMDQLIEAQKASQAEIDALKNTNADLKNEKKAVKKNADEAKNTALKENGEFKALAERLQAEKDAMDTELSQGRDAASKLSQLEIQFEGIRNSAKASTESRMKTWTAEAQTQFDQLYPKHAELDPLELSRNAEAFESAIIGVKTRPAQPHAQGMNPGQAPASPAKTVQDTIRDSLGIPRQQ